MLFKCFFFFFHFGQILFSPVRFAAHGEKSFVLAFFKVYTDHLFGNLESGKSFEFWVLKSVRTLCLKMYKTGMPVEQPAKILKDIHLIKAPFLRFVLVLCDDPKWRLRMTIYFVRISDVLPLGIKGGHFWAPHAVVAIQSRTYILAVKSPSHVIIG